jgi:hypothetical protein
LRLYDNRRDGAVVAQDPRDAAAAPARFRFDHDRSQTVPRPLRRPRGEGLGRRAARDDVNNFISCEAATQFASHVVHDAARDRELLAQLAAARHGDYYAAVVYELAGVYVLLDVNGILIGSHFRKLMLLRRINRASVRLRSMVASSVIPGAGSYERAAE